MGKNASYSLIWFRIHIISATPEEPHPLTLEKGALIAAQHVKWLQLIDSLPIHKEMTLTLIIVAA
jgi:hypothetical protein